jgi:hypothetical protein
MKQLHRNFRIRTLAAPCDRYCSASEFPLSGLELP